MINKFSLYLLLLMFYLTIFSKQNCEIYDDIFIKCLASQFKCQECNEILFKVNNINCSRNCKKRTKNNVYNSKIKEYIKKISIKYNVDYRVIYAIIEVESNWKLNIISNKGAIGLMQVKYNTAKYIAPKLVKNKEDLKNYRKNIVIGVKYFVYLLKLQKMNYKKALAAYNIGPTAFRTQYNKYNKYPKSSIIYINRINRVLKKQFKISLDYFNKEIVLNP